MIPSEDFDRVSYEDIIVNSKRYRVPEGSIRLDFWRKVHIQPPKPERRTNVVESSESEQGSADEEGMGGSLPGSPSVPPSQPSVAPLPPALSLDPAPVPNSELDPLPTEPEHTFIVPQPPRPSSEPPIPLPEYTLQASLPVANPPPSTLTPSIAPTEPSPVESSTPRPIQKITLRLNRASPAPPKLPTVNALTEPLDGLDLSVEELAHLMAVVS